MATRRINKIAGSLWTGPCSQSTSAEAAAPILVRIALRFRSAARALPLRQRVLSRSLSPSPCSPAARAPPLSFAFPVLSRSLSPSR